MVGAELVTKVTARLMSLKRRPRRRVVDSMLGPSVDCFAGMMQMLLPDVRSDGIEGALTHAVDVVPLCPSKVHRGTALVDAGCSPTFDSLKQAGDRCCRM